MRTILNSLVVLIAMASIAYGQTEVFTIGNSLTNDTRPQILDGSQWHIYCSKNLDYIFNNPEGHCVPSSNPWTNALLFEQFEYLTVQPFAGTTLQQDRDIISAWMDMQPQAKIVIHSGWTARETFPMDYLQGNPDDMMRPTPEYMADLVAELRALHPGRVIIQTRANDLLFSVWMDVEAGIGPFDNFRLDLFRDFIHMHFDTGRYLMHQAMRYALSQPLFDRSEFPNTTIAEFEYLEQKIRDVVVVRGDMNRDGAVNLLDVDGFVDVLSSAEYDICGDFNEDGFVDLVDISGFIAKLSSAQN